ncbi:MAG TPA: lysophospholipid acyltransferase family protein [Acetobacteraceae bacterium]|nr:lysophospholipid acyltransferase family protein [Acetobacteraceae bacterium]
MPEPDPLARQSPFLFRLFGWYLRWLFWRRFHAVRIARAGLPDVPPGRPVIVCSNHPSWWDPAFFILLQISLFPGRTGFGPMDAGALGKYGVLERMGVFGIELDSARGAARFLRTSLRILADPARVLWITAQGAFADPRARPVRLLPGIAHLLRRVPEAVVLPLAMEYPFWDEGKPEALARFGPPLQAGRERSVAEWTSLLEAELEATMDALAAESQRRDPRLFQPLMRGSVAVGPVYSAYRRVRALASGRAMDVSHGGGE